MGLLAWRRDAAVTGDIGQAVGARAIENEIGGLGALGPVGPL